MNLIFLARFFYNIDIRKYGSGNAGATNTFRVLGTMSGVIVLLLDILKGYVVVNYIYFIINIYNCYYYI